MFHGMYRLGISSAEGLVKDEVVCKAGVRLVHGLDTLGARNVFLALARLHGKSYCKFNASFRFMIFCMTWP